MFSVQAMSKFEPVLIFSQQALWPGQGQAITVGPDAEVGVCQNSIMPTVRVFVKLKPSLLDSAGRTVAGSLGKLGFDEVEDARIGKMVELKVESYDEARIKEMCDRLLANPVIEDYTFEVAE